MKVQSVRVDGDTLTLTLLEGFREVEATYEGVVTSSFSVGTSGFVAVSFHVSPPPSGDVGVLPLPGKSLLP